MKMKKKIFSFFLVLAMVFSCLQLPNITANAEDTKDPTAYLRFRYEREDKTYNDEENIIVSFDDSKDGVSLNLSDDYGKYAVVEVPAGTKKIAYKVGEGKEKECDADALLNKEILTSVDKDGKVTEKITDLNKDKADITVRLHYFRYDQNYEKWDVWSWIDGGNGAAYTFEEEEFKEGKTAQVTEIPAEKLAAKTNINFLVRKIDWSQKDPDENRSINKAYANKDGVIDAYVVTGEKTVYYDKNDVDISPKVTAARVDSYNNISFTTNYPITNDDVKGKITLKQKERDVLLPKDDKEYNEEEITGLDLTDGSFSGTITTKEKINLKEKEYVLAVEGYGEVPVTIGKLYNTDEYAEDYTFSGKLGAVYSKDSTQFTLWSPMADSVRIAFYGKDSKVIDNDPTEIYDMDMDVNGSWTYKAEGDLDGEFYNYIVYIDGKENIVTDPYAKAVGVNGKRGMVVDLEKTNPEGWDKDSRVELESPTDSVIYEMHIRDFTINESSGANIKYAGKYKGVWQSGTTIPESDVKTGIDHLKELGVNTVHIMPTYDYTSVDETKLDEDQYNWGYDPQNYNVPEGSYSTDPYTGSMRIEEFKEMVKGLHDAGIRVVMDVVYNHTALTTDSNLNLAAPYYYYRENDDFTFSNGSGCGNELASERSMVRKLIVDSIVYLADEYHLDGFRFDLMGCIDQDTMKEIRTKLDKIDKNILVYGEGWTGGSSALDSSKASFKASTPNFGDMQIAAFSDDIRDGIKGNVFDAKGTGFINGGSGYEETIKFGIVASTKNDQIDNTKVVNKTTPWANEPYQTITYASAHDNYTLWDKLQISCPSADEAKLIAMNKMSAAIIYTSQGIPFMQAGEEMARTKVNADGTLNENSYNAPDSVNSIDWNRKVEYSDLYNYYKGLISLRNNHRAFKMTSTEDIQNNLKFLDVEANKVVAYTLNGKAVGDSFDNIAVIFNANDYRTETVTLPSNDWVVIVNGETAGTSKIKDIKGNTIEVEPKSSYVLVDKESYYRTHPNEKPDEDKPEDSDKPGTTTPGDKPGDSDKPATTTPGDKPSEDKPAVPDDEDKEEPSDDGTKDDGKKDDTKPGTTTTETPKDDKPSDGNKEDTFDGNNVMIILLMSFASVAFVLKLKRKAR